MGFKTEVLNICLSITIKFQYNQQQTYPPSNLYIILLTIQSTHGFMHNIANIYFLVLSAQFLLPNLKYINQHIDLYIKNMTNLGQIRKSPSDNRVYKAIRLQNNLQCLLIQDVDALKSSAALSVGVGSFKDPFQAQGLAHYLQHMLFMGTQKYPDENQYSNFITKNGGSNNAYTSQEQTNYMFQVESSVFQQTLDRFAQFFISPLIKRESAEKELEAVHSEHQKNILNDTWRKYQLTKHLSKQNHPYNKFSTGDKNTLNSTNLQQILHKFYEENYSANLMKLVIYGKEDVETLSKWAVEKFSDIKDKSLTEFRLSEQPFDAKTFQKIITIVPIQDIRKVELMFVLKNKQMHYKNHPGTYISNLIGHEGKGSLLSFLIKEDLVTGLSSGNYDTYRTFTQFSISIDLTMKGLGKINEVIGYVLYYIKMLRQNECPQWFFEQLKLINNLKFQYMDKKKGMSETSKMAKKMQTIKIQQLIVYPYLAEQWRPDLIKEYLEQLTLQNLIVLVQAKQFQSKCSQQEPIYKTKFCVNDLGKIQPLTCDVHLPEQNIFLPKDLSILPLEQEKLPELIYKSGFIQTFYKHDHVFNLPKANVNLRLIFNGQFDTLQSLSRTILLEMMKQSSREFTYLAQMAQIEIQTSFVSYFSIDIKFKGYRDSLKIFITEYLKRLFEFEPSDQQLLNTLKQKHKRRYKNNLLNDPYRIAYDRANTAMKTNVANSDREKLQEVDNVNLQHLKKQNREWKQYLFGQIYFSGNIKKEESLEITDKIENFLQKNSKKLLKSKMGQMRAINLKPNQIALLEETLQNKQEQNQALQVHLQVEQVSLRSEILIKLTELISKEPAFDYLRTQQKLGYIVFCLADDHRGVNGLTLIVQSSVKSSYQIVDYIDKFIYEKLFKIVNELSEEQFKTYKKALKSQKEEKDKNLGSETLRYWTEIVKHQYVFNKKSLELQLIQKLTLDQLKSFINDSFFTNQKRLQIHIGSTKKYNHNQQIRRQRFENNKQIKVYKNVDDLSRRSQLYPDYYAPNQSS